MHLSYRGSESEKTTSNIVHYIYIALKLLQKLNLLVIEL